MRPSTSLLVSIKPLPATSFAQIRLPPALGRVTRSGTEPLAKHDNPQKMKVKPDQTVAQHLARKATEASARADPSWPSNLRIEEHVSKKDLYWKVSKSQRDVLKKQLREA